MIFGVETLIVVEYLFIAAITALILGMIAVSEMSRQMRTMALLAILLWAMFWAIRLPR